MTLFGSSLRLHRGHASDAGRRTAYQALMGEVLGLSPALVIDRDWTPFSVFDADDRCVANVDAAILPLAVDGMTTYCAGIRSIAVDPRWRGRGLFRTLMGEALAWCDRQAAGPALLYTAEPAIYERFGFRPVAQHAFLGPAPHAETAKSVLVEHPSQDLMASIVARRAPVSSQAALMVGTDLFMANARGDEDLGIAYVRLHDAIVIFERGDDMLVIVDIAAPRIPPLATLLPALGSAPKRIKTLFPPDRLGWQGEPALEETGLMARGALPEGMSLPFMFPPTTEF